MRSSALLSTLILVGCFDPSARGPASSSESTGTDAITGETTQVRDTDPPVEESTSTGEDTTPPPSESSSSSSEEGPIVECDAGEGEADPACPDDAPFCFAGVCNGCDDAPAFHCAAAFPDAPACDPNGACVACDEHAACESGACRIADGRCFPATNTLQVDNHAACASADGSEAAPMCSIDAALDVVATQPAGAAWLVRVAGSTDAYEGTVAIPSDHVVAIVGPDAGLAATLRGTGTWTVRSHGEAYVARVLVEGGADAISVSAGELWLDDAVVQNADRGIAADGGRTHVRRTSLRNHNTLAIDVQPGAELFVRDATIAENIGAMRVAGEAELHGVTVTDNYVDGGIWVGGTLRVRNGFLHDNLYVRGAIEAVDGSNVDVLYTTIVDAFECTSGATVSIRNSIAIGGLDCAATINTSVVDPGFGMPGEGNLELASEELVDVFVFPDPYEPDYHLLPGTSVLGVARWRTGDPPYDIDGDARPSIDDSPDAPGADAI